MDTGIVLLSVVVTVGSAEAVSIKQGHGFTMKPIIAGFVLGGVLFLIGSLNPGLGTAFAWLVMVVSLLRNGAVLFGAAGDLVAGAPSKPGKPKTAH